MSTSAHNHCSAEKFEEFLEKFTNEFMKQFVGPGYDHSELLAIRTWLKGPGMPIFRSTSITHLYDNIDGTFPDDDETLWNKFGTKRVTSIDCVEDMKTFLYQCFMFTKDDEGRWTTSPRLHNDIFDTVFNKVYGK